MSHLEKLKCKNPAEFVTMVRAFPPSLPPSLPHCRYVQTTNFHLSLPLPPSLPQVVFPLGRQPHYLGHIYKAHAPSFLPSLLHSPPQVVFGVTFLLAGSQLMGFQPHYLGHNLSCYLVYIWSRMFEGQVRREGGREGGRRG